jgi:hypothetical protein
MKLFSPEKANALIPLLEPLIDELWTRRRELAIQLLGNDLALRSAGKPGAQAAGSRRNDARRVAEMKAEIIAVINRIEAHGCVVKDVTLGLLDFPALRDGRPVFLCWKPGEPQIGYWHRADESYADRKEL